MNRPSPATPIGGALVESARWIVLSEVREPRSSREVGAAAARACDKLAEHLARLVGRHGVAALLRRSLHVTSERFPWLEPAAIGSSEPAALCAALQAQPVDLALDASEVLL